MNITSFKLYPEVKLVLIISFNESTLDLVFSNPSFLKTSKYCFTCAAIIFTSKFSGFLYKLTNLSAERSFKLSSLTTSLIYGWSNVKWFNASLNLETWK